MRNNFRCIRVRSVQNARVEQYVSELEQHLIISHDNIDQHILVGDDFAQLVQRLAGNNDIAEFDVLGSFQSGGSCGQPVAVCRDEFEFAFGQIPQNTG
ncbi:hypothetical protein D3C72_1945390 [compost metagenome]